MVEVKKNISRIKDEKKNVKKNKKTLFHNAYRLSCFNIFFGFIFSGKLVHGCSI